MYIDALIWEVAVARVRQRKILEILRERKLTEWDGAIVNADPAVREVFDQIKADMRADNPDTA